MKLIYKEIPFLLIDVPNHQEVSGGILRGIESMGTFSYVNSNQSLSNTDWHLRPDFFRPYQQHMSPIFQDTIDKVADVFNMDHKLEVLNYWFQVYKKGDFHAWHTHGRSSFSCIYYVKLPQGVSKTSFIVNNIEFGIDVAEGQILVCPAMVTHCSKPNLTDKEKIVVVFNI